MFSDQPGKDGPILCPTGGAQKTRFGLRQARICQYSRGHFNLDLIKNAHRGRVERVVEVKHVLKFEKAACIMKSSKLRPRPEARRGCRGGLSIRGCGL